MSKSPKSETLTEHGTAKKQKISLKTEQETYPYWKAIYRNYDPCNQFISSIKISAYLTAMTAVFGHGTCLTAQQLIISNKQEIQQTFIRAQT